MAAGIVATLVPRPQGRFAMSSALAPNAQVPPALAAALADWRRLTEAELNGVPAARRLVTRTVDGLSVGPLYTRADLTGLAGLDEAPGEGSRLRGLRAGPPGRWLCLQEVRAGNPADFNRLLLEALAGGQDAVVLPVDGAVRRNEDPDTAEVGRVGVGGLSLATVGDVETALAGVALGCVPLWAQAGADARPLAALVLAAAGRAGVPAEALKGGIVADPVAAWLIDGDLPVPRGELWAGTADWTRWASRHAPGLRTVGVDASLWADAGATAVQELAFALATTVGALRGLEAEGVPVSLAVSHLRVRLGVGTSFFTEIAKFRAFRLLWSRVVQAFGCTEAAGDLALHARTAAWSHSTLDPHVNLLRATTSAGAAVIGGCDGLHIAPFDESEGGARAFSQRLARNLHTLLADEFLFTATADAAGGSWYLEALTDDLARQAWALFQETERRGGMIAALASGWPQACVETAADEKAKAVALRRIGLVGVNVYPNLREPPRERKGPAPAWAAERAAGVRTARREAPALLCGFDAALRAAREGATLGQLAGALSRHSGRHDPVHRLIVRRGAEGFERLRAMAETYRAREGRRPGVLLLRLGTAAQSKARADFSAGFFAAGGFEAVASDPVADDAAAVQLAMATTASVVVLCSTDEVYTERLPAVAGPLKQARPELIVILAGLPTDPSVVVRYRAAGVDDFIHLRADAEAVLGGLLTRLGLHL